MNTVATPRNRMTGFAMRGGVNLDNMEAYPDGNYWRHGAEAAIDKLIAICPKHYEDHIRLVMRQIWNNDFTWMDICKQTEGVLELVQAHANMLDPVSPDEHALDADWRDEMDTRESVRPS